ncbi:ribosome small subunit-dependent GTPase A [Streptomyces sp. H27-C3]|uniref:ribosome small subunit-dependent GTPase A n=1 Tax=Streptomyces sp. H27-C3 TaxID=3046305 RepID=UPI0024B885AB|nr:ribosome small subunit-dependent GTPase A [Streptomyces sp. H27-C3]MDJ0466746.1 ribosome small subunit-dependent GTPase A [Streptomyces sp. H27-C3]
MRHSSVSADSVYPRPLEAYGWSTELDDIFTSVTDGSSVPGRVVRVDRGRCDVVIADGDSAVSVVHADTGPVADPDPMRLPCTGDWAAVSISAAGTYVQALLPRRTAMVRSSASQRSEGQVLAANVDTIAIAVSLDAEPDLGRIERFLALAWESGAQPLMVLTKSDLAEDADAVRETVEQAAPGVDVLVVSATTGEGMDILGACLSGTNVLVGQSGAGKSTIANALLGRSAMDVQKTRGDGKGRHTTTTRELMPLPGGGVLIDTPGVRGVGMYDASDGLQQVFSEIEALAEDCRFRDCEHFAEPGCAVVEAIEDGMLPQRRLDSYRKLVRENEWIASRSDARLRQDRLKDLKAQGKQGMANMIAKRG